MERDESRFHTNEILPDYQARTRSMLAELRALPDVVINHVGVEEIDGRNARERCFIEFAHKSSLHGLNHVVARRRHPVERILAIAAIGVCLLLNIWMSYICWRRYQDEATVESIDLDRMLFTIRSPSFLICPANRTDESKFPATFQRYGVEDTPVARSFFRFLSNVEYENMHKTPDFDAVPPGTWLPILNELRNEFRPGFDDAKQNTTLYSVITERGICVSVRNYMSIYTTFEYWMQNNWTVIPRPKPVPSYNIDDHGKVEAISVMAPMSVTITPYDPGEVVEYHRRQLHVESPVIAWYGISTVARTISPTVTTLSVTRRKCKFSRDGGLKMWPVYTLNMCVMECRYRTIQQRCGCLPHFARPIAGVPVCNAAQLRCIAAIKNHLFLRTNVPARCNCLLNCNQNSYYVDKKTDMHTGGGADVNQTPAVQVNIIVNFPEYIYRQEEVFGFNEFMTAVGSAASLFLGASVLTYVEVFYYVTLRMWVYCLRNKLRRRGRVDGKPAKNKQKQLPAIDSRVAACASEWKN